MLQARAVQWQNSSQDTPSSGAEPPDQPAEVINMSDERDGEQPPSAALANTSVYNRREEWAKAERRATNCAAGMLSRRPDSGL